MKKAKGKQTDKEAARILKIAGNTFIFFYVLCISTLIAIIVIESTPQSVLARNLNGYDYFLAGRQIDSHQTMPPHPQDSLDRIKTSIEIEKIPQLLGSNIIKACESNKYECSDPLWQKGWGRQYCTTASWKQSPTTYYIQACVDIDSGEFMFERVDI